VAIPTRRHRPRVSLKETAHLMFLPGIRGVVVDISEGGLKFKTSSPLKNSSQVSKFRFAFSGGGEVLADLAWTDESHTMGGLKFRSVSPEVRQQARAWMRQGWETSRGIAGPSTAAALSAAGRRRLAIVALIVLFFLGAATAAGYLDPGGARDVMARAQHIVTRVTIRIRNLPMPRLNRQRPSGAVTRDGYHRLTV
jgi:hypothetical protein